MATKIDLQREMILSARIRFSPHTQPLKETAIDGIVENILSVEASDESIGAEDIAKTFAAYTNGLVLPTPDVVASLRRLELEERVKREESGRASFRLSVDREKELSGDYTESINQFDRVGKKLFGDDWSKDYLEGLWLALASVFEALGEAR